MHGRVEAIVDGSIVGWIWDPMRPDDAIEIRVLEGDREIARAVACEPREELAQGGYGNGKHGFSVVLPKESLGRASALFSVFAADNDYELRSSPLRHDKPRVDDAGIELMPVFRVDPKTIAAVAGSERTWRFGRLLIDVIASCNASCIYCPNWQSGERMESADFQVFFERVVVRADFLQIGCGHEPTAHFGLGEFLRIVARFRHKIGWVQMITNGTLLRRHLPTFRASLLDELQISVDSPSAETSRKLRPGTDLPAITRAIEAFRRESPETLLSFSTVVTSVNYPEMEELVRFGQGLGVRSFIFREVYDHASNGGRPGVSETIDSISLADGEMARLKDRILSRFPRLRASFVDRGTNVRSRPQTRLGQVMTPEIRAGSPSQKTNG